MKAVIFNLLEEVIVDAHGEQTWEDVLDLAGLDGVYTSLGNYDDAEIMHIVSAVSSHLSVTDDDALRWFGQRAIPGMAERWPHFFTPHRRAVELLRTLNDVIHPEVRKLYSGTDCPHFNFPSSTDASLVIGYRSPRKLCRLAHGFILGVGDHFGETLRVNHLECMHEGSDRCLLAVTAT